MPAPTNLVFRMSTSDVLARLREARAYLERHPEVARVDEVTADGDAPGDVREVTLTIRFHDETGDVQDEELLQRIRDEEMQIQLGQEMAEYHNEAVIRREPQHTPEVRAEIERQVGATVGESLERILTSVVDQLLYLPADVAQGIMDRVVARYQANRDPQPNRAVDPADPAGWRREGPAYAMAQMLANQEGRQQLARSMAAPIRRELDRQSLGRRLFQVQPLPEGAVPAYLSAPVEGDLNLDGPLYQQDPLVAIWGSAPYQATVEMVLPEVIMGGLEPMPNEDLYRMSTLAGRVEVSTTALARMTQGQAGPVQVTIYGQTREYVPGPVRAAMEDMAPEDEAIFADVMTRAGDDPDFVVVGGRLPLVLRGVPAVIEQMVEVEPGSWEYNVGGVRLVISGDEMARLRNGQDVTITASHDASPGMEARRASTGMGQTFRYVWNEPDEDRGESANALREQLRRNPEELDDLIRRQADWDEGGEPLSQIEHMLLNRMDQRPAVVLDRDLPAIRAVLGLEVGMWVKSLVDGREAQVVIRHRPDYLECRLEGGGRTFLSPKNIDQWAGTGMKVEPPPVPTAYDFLLD